MRSPLLRCLRIIGALCVAAVLLGGCGSMLRVSYGQAPNLLYWWLDGYLDFDDSQSRAVRDALDAWFRWHRATQLPEYAELLARARTQVRVDATPEQACAWWQQVRSHADTALDHALPAAATIALTLTPEQLEHLDKRYAKALDDARRDYAQDDPQERQRAAVKRTLERAEMLYGRFDDGQRRLVAERVAASPFDPTRWIAERAARQRETLAALRRIVTERPTLLATQTTLRGLVARAQVSPRAEYEAYATRLTTYNCDFAARIHNATTPAQREHASERLATWEADLRQLSGGVPAAATAVR